MSDAQYRPGSWGWYWREDEKGEADCGVFSEKPEGHAYSVCRAPRYQTKEQWEKDAPLICAAPDMHLALKIISEWFITHPDNLDAHNMALVARDALASVEGRAP